MLGENDASSIPAAQLVPPREGSSVLRWKCSWGCTQVALHILWDCLATPELGWDRQQSRDSPALCTDSHDTFQPHFPGIIY